MSSAYYDKLVDDAARAIAEENCNEEEWHAFYEDGKVAVDAVLARLATPSEGMVEAGTTTNMAAWARNMLAWARNWQGEPADVHDVWSSMIGAVKAE